MVPRHVPSCCLFTLRKDRWHQRALVSLLCCFRLRTFQEDHERTKSTLKGRPIHPDFGGRKGHPISWMCLPSQNIHITFRFTVEDPLYWYLPQGQPTPISLLFGQIHICLNHLCLLTEFFPLRRQELRASTHNSKWPWLTKVSGSNSEVWKGNHYLGALDGGES